MYLLSLDQGTTSSRALVFDRHGVPLAVAQKEFRQHFPQPGWVEHDPAEIWSTQLGVAHEAMARAGISAAELAGIGLTNQRETVVLWERSTGRPLHRAIVWQDRRTAGMCDELRAAGLEPIFQQRTGLLLDPYFSGTKLRWLLDEVPQARERAQRGELAFGTIDSWLVWNLTGGALHLTDATNASRTLLYNLHTGDWDDELLGHLNIPRAVMPEVRGSSEHYGNTAPALLGAAVPLAGIAGDQQAALFGQACHRPGMAKNTYGTGCFVLMNTGSRPRPSAHRLLSTVAWKLGASAEFALEGSVFSAGAVVQWLRDGLGLIRSAAEVEGLARTVPDTGGVYLVPAFVGLGAPYWDSYARGAILGLTRGTTAAHLARAALESMAFQSVEVLRAMEADSGIAMSELRVDGGAAANDLLMQIQADLLGVPVVRSRITETTALGAAYLAGLARGVWSGQEEIAAQWSADRVFEPAMDADLRRELLAEWRRAVQRSLAWVE